jgi:hypothetical protein
MDNGNGFVRDQELLHEARQYKSELLDRMFGVSALAAESEPGRSALPAGSNVVGIGYGAKVTVGAGVFDSPVVRVYVRTKVPVGTLDESDMVRVPPEVNGLPTDVVQVGDLSALARPTMSGVSVGHFAVTAGTLGCVVHPRGSEGDHYMLSNNHVLANSNNAVPGDDILEPGPMDGGDPNNPIADLTDFEPLNFAGPNVMDAATARLRDLTDVNPEILGGIGRVQQPPTLAALYQSVRKHGRTTRHTIGVIMDLAADIDVRYGTKLASFENQIAVTGVGGQFSDGGDSGSLVVDAVTRSPVGLLFAGGLNTTFANPITPVLDRFGVDIV